MPKNERIKGNGTQRVTKIEKQNRVETSAVWLLENPDTTFTEFLKWIEAKYNYQRSQGQKYWKLAKKELNDTISEDPESARKLAEASLKRMLRKALDLQDDRLALEIRKEINKISGVYTQKIEINDVTEQPIFNFTPIKASEIDEGE